MIGSIVSSNAKHQVIIPKEVRDALGIDKPVKYYVTVSPTQKITYEPIESVSVSQRAKNLAYLKILKKTQGAWAGDNWPKTEAKQKKLELEAAKKLKQESW